MDQQKFGKREYGSRMTTSAKGLNEVADTAYEWFWGNYHG